MNATLTQVEGATETPAETRAAVKKAISQSVTSGRFVILAPSPERARMLSGVSARSEFGTDFYGANDAPGNPSWLVILADLDA